MSSTEYLRERDGEVEVARLSHHYTAKDRSNALTVLRGCVRILRHPYERDPFSGAGNCWCGRAELAQIHRVVAAPQPNPRSEK